MRILVVEDEHKIANSIKKGLNLGADDYLTKPFAFTELLTRIKALTRRNGSKVEIILKVRDLTLNTSTDVVKRDNKQISLSKTEFSILEFLISA